MVDLVTVRLGGNAPLLGAAELALTPTLDDPAAMPMNLEPALADASELPDALEAQTLEAVAQG
jgi:hypothetical protein